MSDQGRLVAGRYRLVERIGSGGMGTVWRADDEFLTRQVAVKKLHWSPLQLDGDELEALFERTRREARSAARINHPNVVVVHDVVDDEGSPSIVMEYVPSVTLAEVISKHGPVRPEEAARIGRGVVAALRAAHDARVVHRDIKPGNVLLGREGRVVLTDFGIAVASGTSTLTQTGQLVGSIDFCSPERLTGGTPGPESDLWALGATLYQAVEGRLPFRRDTPIETAYAIASEPVPSAPAAGPLAPLIEGLLVKDPSLRLTADEVERMLQTPQAATAVRVRRTSAEPGTSPRSVGAMYTVTNAASSASSRRPRNRKALGLVAAAAVVTIASAATIMIDGAGGDTTEQTTAQARAHTMPASSSASPSKSPPASRTSPTATMSRTPDSGRSSGQGLQEPSRTPQAPPSGRTEDGPLRSDGSIDPGSNVFWAQSDITIRTTKTLTSLIVELRVAQTGGVSSTGAWRTRPQEDFTLTVEERDDFLVYRWTLKDGRTVPAGEHMFAGQYNHETGRRDAGGDSYAAAATADGEQCSVRGDFA